MKQQESKVALVMTEKKCSAAVGIAIMAAALILFGRYLFNQYYFVFPQMVNDGITQFYPQYLAGARAFAEERVLNYYTFANGFGRWQGTENPFQILIIAFGEKNVAYMMGVKYILCVLLSGGMFGFFLREAKCGHSTCVFGGVSYALSTQVIIGGCWQTQGELAIIAALALFVIQRIQNKRIGIVGLLICLGLVHTCLSAYYLLLYGGLLVLYLLVRFIYLNGAWEKWKHTTRWLVAMAGIMLILAAAIFLSFKLQGIFKSSRFQEGIQAWGHQWRNTVSLENLQTIATAFFRTLSPDILGISMVEEYKGGPFGWFSEDPGFYVGLLPLLLLTNVSKTDISFRLKKVIGFLFAIAFIFICFPGVRLLVNGFANDTFKLSRLWITLILLGCAIIVWEKSIEGQCDFSYKRILAGCSVIGMALAVGCLYGKDYLRKLELIEVIVFLCIYAFLLYKLKAGAGQKCIWKYLLLLTVVVELTVFNYRFINNGDAVRSAELQNGYYMDGTQDVLKIIEEIEAAGNFYRVNKSYESVLCCDPVAQGYNSTTFYRGGADDVNMTKFLKLTGIPSKSNRVGYCTGTYGYPVLSALLGVKYGISQDSVYMEQGYTFWQNIGDKTLWYNANAMPMAFVYHTAISATELNEYSVRERQDILTQCCVIDGSSESGTAQEMQDFAFNQAVPVRTMTYETYEVGTPIEFDAVSADEILVVNLENEKDVCVNMFWSTTLGRWSDKDYRTLSVYGENRNTFIEIDNQDEINGLIFYSNDDEWVETIDKIVLEVYSRREYEAFLLERMETLKEEAAYDVTDSEIGFTMNLSVKEQGVLFFSVPYDAPYQYFLNGQYCETTRANYIFTGIWVEPGDYKVEMRKK